MTRVFTIDQDNDGRVDNVGFVLQGRGQGEMLLRYNGGGGQLAAAAVEGLRIPDEGRIGRLCFGHITFEMAAPEVSRPVFALPNLAREAQGRGEEASSGAAIVGASRVTVVSIGDGGFPWLLVGGSMVAGAAALAAIWFLLRRFGVGKRRRRDPVEDELDDDIDEDEDVRV